MKVGELVIMSNAKDCTLHPGLDVGIIIDDQPVKNRIGVTWAGETCVDFEPVKWLEVVK